MLFRKLFLVMAIAVMMAPATGWGETREAVVECAGSGDLFRTEVNCAQPGQWFNLVAACPGGDQKLAYQCDPGEKPAVKLGRTVLLLDAGLAAGALGVDEKMGRAFGMFHLAIEARFTQWIGLMAQGNIGLTGEVIKDQLGGVPSSYWAGGVLLTLRPADFVRLAIGANGYTVKTKSFVRALSGVTGTVRADFWFARDWSVGVAGEVGPAWDPWDKVHVFWSVVGGVTYHPALLNNGK